MIVGLSYCGGTRGQEKCPSVVGLRKAGFDGVKFRNDNLVIQPLNIYQSQTEKP